MTARAQAVRQVAEDQDLSTAEFNRAFVLIQYFGYLRRNPNDPQDTDYTGFDFWLTKLNQFNGNFVSAEMVKTSSSQQNTCKDSVYSKPDRLPTCGKVYSPGNTSTGIVSLDGEM